LKPSDGFVKPGEDEHARAKIGPSVRLLNRTFQKPFQFCRRPVAATFDDVRLLAQRKRIKALSQRLSAIKPNISALRRSSQVPSIERDFSMVTI
jgi:hypothetical protein